MKLLDLLTEAIPFKSTFSDEEVKAAYAEAQTLPEYKRILDLGFVDDSSAVQAKRGNFEFSGDNEANMKIKGGLGSTRRDKLYYKVYAHGMIRTGDGSRHTRLRVPVLTQDDLLENYKRMFARVGDVINSRLHKVPLKRFGKKQELSDDPLKPVNGDMVIDGDGVESLVGSPRKVKSLKITANSHLDDLSGGPEIVTNELMLDGVGIKSLKGAPKDVRVVHLSSMGSLTSLEGLPDTVEVITIARCPKLKNLRGLPKRLKALNMHDIHLDTLEGLGREFVLKCDSLKVYNFTTKSHALALLLISNSKTKFRWGVSWDDDSEIGKILARHIEKGKSAMIDAQHELIAAGYEYQAKV